MGCKSKVVRIAALVLTLPAVAPAQVVQTDEAATPLPQAVGLGEFNLVTFSWAYAQDTRVNTDAAGIDVFDLEYYFEDYYPTFEDGDAITLEGLFKWRGEAIEPVTDAVIAPGHFTPSCGFSVELVLRGSDCQVALGWYNIDDPESETPPAAEEIYELVPPDTDETLDCQPPLDNGFCPLAWDNVDPRQLDTERWTPATFDGSAILDDSDYAGGAIGLALIGDPESSCSANKYSLYGQNQKNSAGDAWVTALVFPSSVSPGSFYLAFEDLPMSAADWHETGVPGNNGTNDGDFNDLVYFVSVTDCPSSGAGGSTNGSGGAGDAGSDAGPSSSSGGSSGSSAGADNGGSGGDGSTGDSGGSATESGGATSAGSGGTTAGVTSSTSNSGGTGAMSSGGSGAAGGSGATASSGGLECTPGRQLECTCSDARKGSQVCNAAGDGFSLCDCVGTSPNEAGGCGCRLSARESSEGQLPWGAGLVLLGLSATMGRRLRRSAD